MALAEADLAEEPWAVEDLAAEVSEPHLGAPQPGRGHFLYCWLGGGSLSGAAPGQTPSASSWLPSVTCSWQRNVPLGLHGSWPGRGGAVVSLAQDHPDFQWGRSPGAEEGLGGVCGAQLGMERGHCTNSSPGLPLIIGSNQRVTSGGAVD